MPEPWLCISKSHSFYSLFLSPATAGCLLYQYPILFDPELIRFDTSQAAARVRVCLDRLCLAGYAHAGEGRYVMFVSVPIPSVLRRDSSSTGQARSVKDGGGLQFFFIFPLDKH